MTSPIMSEGALVALFNGISLVVVAFLQYKTKKDVQKDVKENTAITKDATIKLDEAKVQVEQVRQMTNGQMTELLHQLEMLKAENETIKAENERLKSEIGQRRSTDH